MENKVRKTFSNLKNNQRKKALRLYTTRSIYQAISQHIPSGCSTVVDLGCGWGRIVSQFDNNLEKFGVDLTLDNLSAAKRLTDQKINLVQSDVKSLPFRDDFFGFAYSVRVIHYLDNKLEFFDEVIRTLKRGGRFVVVQPNKMNPLIWLQYNYYRERPSSETFTVSELANIGEKSGLTKVDSGHLAFSPPNYDSKGRMEFLKNIPILNKLGGLCWVCFEK